MAQQITRILVGHFDPSKADQIEKMIAENTAPLAAALKTLKGNLGFYGGIDRAKNIVVTVGIWESVEAAKQLDTF